MDPRSKVSAARQRQFVAKLLENWGKAADEVPMPRPLGKVLLEFKLTPGKIVSQFDGAHDVDLSERGIWVVGPPTEGNGPPQWPIVSAAAWLDENERFNAEVRLALVSNESSVFSARGWRFDMPELGDNSPRPFAHVQPINGWHKAGPKCLIHPHKTSDRCNSRSIYISGAQSGNYSLPLANETYPAFPLVVETLPGLVTTIISSLYGGAKARSMLVHANLRSQPGYIKDDVSRVVGQIS